MKAETLTSDQVLRFVLVDALSRLKVERIIFIALIVEASFYFLKVVILKGLSEFSVEFSKTVDGCDVFERNKKA